MRAEDVTPFRKLQTLQGIEGHLGRIADALESLVVEEPSGDGLDGSSNAFYWKPGHEPGEKP